MSRVAAGLLLAAGTLLPGYAILCLIAGGRRLSASLTASLSFAIGAGALGVTSFWISLAGIRPGIASVTGQVLAASVLLIVLWRRGARVRSPEEPATRLRWDEWALCAVVALPCVWVAADALLVPIFNIDAVGIWSFKAKVLAHEPVRSSGYFHDETLSYSHLDYPLLVPFLTAAAHGVRGTWDEPLGKLFHAGVFFALVLLLYGGVRLRLSRRSSLFLLILYLVSPALLGQATAGIADPSLMLYYAGSLIFLLSWLKTDDTADLRIGSLMSAFLLFTKNEGMALAAINLVVFSLAASRSAGMRRAAALSRHAALVILLTLPWLVFRAGIPKTHENYAARLRPSVVLENLDRVPEILITMGRTVVDLRMWGGLWLLLPVVWLLAGRSAASRGTGALWACLIGHLAVYVLIFVITPWDVRQLLGAKAYPLLLQASPALLLLLAPAWSKLQP